MPVDAVIEADGINLNAIGFIGDSVSAAEWARQQNRVDDAVLKARMKWASSLVDAPLRLTRQEWDRHTNVGEFCIEHRLFRCAEVLDWCGGWGECFLVEVTVYQRGKKPKVRMFGRVRSRDVSGKEEALAYLQSLGLVQIIDELAS